MPGLLVKRVLVVLVLLCAMVLIVGPLAAQENRVALVIGNAAYQAGSALKTPVNDAIEIAGALARDGFLVMLAVDAGRAAMDKAVRDFGNRLQDDDTVGLFYYAGHGAQVDGRSYLIPIDADIRAPNELRRNTMDVESVLALMRSAGNKLTIAVIDASHDNPYPGARRSPTKGLAELTTRVPESVFVLGAQPGSVVPEGNGPDSAFARAFVQQLNVPDQDVTIMMKRLIAQVRSDTGGRQVPWVSSNLTADFSFRSTDAAQGGAAVPTTTTTSGPVTTSAPPPPEPAPLPDLATLDTTSFVKSLPASRITAVTTNYGYYAGQGELGKLDARMPPLVVDAYSYAGVKDEKLNILLYPHEATQQIVLYLRSPSGKTSVFFPSQGGLNASTTLAESGTYTVLVATPETWQLGAYFFYLFGRGSSVAGELTIFDPDDPDVFGNHVDSVPLDLPAATYTLKLESSDFDTAIRVLDASGKAVNGKTDNSGKTTNFTFGSGGGRATVQVRSDGTWPTGKWKLTIQAVGLGGGQ